MSPTGPRNPGPVLAVRYVRVPMPGEDFYEEMTNLGCPVSEWSNGAGFRYAPHSHPYKKFLCCLEGSIVFHLPGGDVTLSPGDRTVIDPGVEHAATVGDTGVRCAEAHAG